MMLSAEIFHPTSKLLSRHACYKTFVGVPLDKNNEQFNFMKISWEKAYEKKSKENVVEAEIKLNLINFF